ncbi:MAG: hypothetical protein NT058_00880 [Candidatus Portnoybacteria bacterium]|nr:hypothetical protein [Candidatus Portnoybacteria bacterium]
MPLIWFSTLSATEGEGIKIYAGIQNNSGIDFKGTATFYIDDKDVSSATFNSSGDSLSAVSVDWKTEVGSHDILVKIVTSLPSDKTLISYESAKSNITVAKKIVKETTKNTVTNTISNVISKIEESVIHLENKIEDLKKPVAVNDKTIDNTADQSNDAYNSSSEESGAVLGVSASLASSSERNNNSKMNSIYNIGVDVLAFLVKNWLWTLGATILILLIIRFKMRRKQ